MRFGAHALDKVYMTHQPEHDGGRDARGRFLKGQHAVLPPAKPPKELTPEHPTLAGRDETGRFVKGCQGGISANHLSSLRKAMHQAVSVEEIQGVVKELVRIALRAKNETTRLEAMELLLNRLFGRPRESWFVDLEATKKAAVEFHNLSDGDLQTIEKLLVKAQAPPALEAKPVED